MKKIDFPSVLILISLAGLIVLVGTAIYDVSSQVYLNWKYSESMHGYFAIEIINETNVDYTVKIMNKGKGETLESSPVDANESLTIIFPGGNESYHFALINRDKIEYEREIYVIRLPMHREQIYLVNGGEIERNLVQNDRVDLAEYQKIINEKYE